MHCYQLVLQSPCQSCLRCDDLMTCSSFVEIKPKKPSLLCASSLIDSDSVIDGVSKPLPHMCVAARTCQSTSCTLQGQILDREWKYSMLEELGA